MTRTLRSVLVVGSGLIGTSVGLALRRHDIDVHLLDRDPDVAGRAAALGAGRAGAPEREPDVVVLAMTPGQVPAELHRVQRRFPLSTCTDVSSAQAAVQARARELGCDLGRYVGGHPMAGRELSGPDAAQADLFEGRPWVLLPTAEARRRAVEQVRELAELCGGRVLLRTAQEHDRAVATVSHLPQLLSSAAAAALAEVPDSDLELAGPGVRDVTRIAASDPALWVDILAANAASLAPLLETAAAHLAAAAAALRRVDAGDPAARAVVEDLLRRGAVGRRRLLASPSSPP